MFIVNNGMAILYEMKYKGNTKKNKMPFMDRGGEGVFEHPSMGLMGIQEKYITIHDSIQTSIAQNITFVLDLMDFIMNLGPKREKPHCQQ
uniref:Uncharacterized protein n=1 Tax=Rhizophora mucronata TaxID=61149 RepID=A0A2P2QDE0_RHIMU